MLHFVYIICSVICCIYFGIQFFLVIMVACCNCIVEPAEKDVPSAEVSAVSTVVLFYLSLLLCAVYFHNEKRPMSIEPSRT